MQVGCFSKHLPMELQCVDEKSGVYNLYAPGQLDYDFIINTIKNPPKDCRFITIFSNDSRNFDSVMEYFKDYFKDSDAKYYKFEKEGFTHYMIDLYNLITEEMTNNG